MWTGERVLWLTERRKKERKEDSRQRAVARCLINRMQIIKGGVDILNIITSCFAAFYT